MTNKNTQHKKIQHHSYVQVHVIIKKGVQLSNKQLTCRGTDLSSLRTQGEGLALVNMTRWGETISSRSINNLFLSWLRHKVSSINERNTMGCDGNRAQAILEQNHSECKQS